MTPRQRNTRAIRRLATPLLAAAIAASLPACAAPSLGQDTRQVAADDYTAAFEAALDVLRNRNFELARIDARAGVIETAPRTSAGALAPWIRHAANAEQGIRGMLHHERRIARVRFAPAAIAAAPAAEPATKPVTPPAADPAPSEQTPDADPPTPPPDDLRRWEGPISLRVVVEIQRLERPGKKYSPTSVQLTRTTLGRTRSLPELTAEPVAVPAGRDTELARVLADEIERASRQK